MVSLFWLSSVTATNTVALRPSAFSDRIAA
jgi:hypothetical protein